jgi:hypothetical protein
MEWQLCFVLSESSRFVVVGWLSGGMVHSVAGSESHENVLQESWRRFAHGLALWTWTMFVQTHGKLSITFAQLMRARIPSGSFRLSWNTIRSTSIALPFEWNKVRQMPLEWFARAHCVTPIMHFATHVNVIDWITWAKKSAETSVAFEFERVATCGALHHAGEVKGRSFAPVKVSDVIVTPRIIVVPLSVKDFVENGIIF